MTASLEEQIGEYRKGLDRVRHGTASADTELARVSVSNVSKLVSKLRCGGFFVLSP